LGLETEKNMQVSESTDDAPRALEADGVGAKIAVMRPGLATMPGDGLPDAFGPMIRNAWYVVAALKDVGRNLLSLKVLGEPLVIYRTEAGRPVVLDDRCAHRRYPLSKSTLIGDTIQCGYHGFTYNPTGRCVWAPGLAVTPRFGVRSYPVAEAGPWLWVWMGEEDKADPGEIPFVALDAAETWHSTCGYKFNPGNYMLLIENLLDLTHLHFLHGAHVSDLVQATTPPEGVVDIKDGVGWTKQTPRTETGFFAALAGADPTKIVRLTTWINQVGPALSYGGEDRYCVEGDDDPLYPFRFRVYHAITPRDENGTHQFFYSAFNRELVDGVDKFGDLSRDVVFEQDATSIGYMQQVIAEDKRAAPREFGIPSDRFGVKMRGILRALKKAEA
jgi:nitrite reductase/ring-hydroxylating ferredoxin subunit